MSDVAVIVPVRDGAAYVREALTSVLAQSDPPAEIVVVDDGSTDGTLGILETFRSSVRVVEQRPSGYAAAVNRGIALSTSPLIASLDADDLWPVRSLEVRVRRMTDDDRDGVDAVCGNLEQFVSPELPPEEAARFQFDPEPRATQLLNTMLVRRRVVERVGPLDETLTTGANIDWVSRARALDIKIAYVDETVSRRRLHRTNTGVRLAGVERELLPRIVRAHRRRMADRPTAAPDET